MPDWDIPGEFPDYRRTATPKVKTPIWASYDTRDEGLPAPQHHQDAGGVYRHHGGRGAADADGAEGQRLDAEPERPEPGRTGGFAAARRDRKSTRLNSSHLGISYAVFCLKKKKKNKKRNSMSKQRIS